MLYVSIVVFLIVLIVILKSWISDLHMNYFESKVNKEIEELKGEEE